MPRAIGSRLALGTIYVRDIIINDIVCNGVFELSVLSSLELVGPGDLQGDTAAIAWSAELLGVLAASLDLDWTSGTLENCENGWGYAFTLRKTHILINTPEPDISRAAIGNHCVTEGARLESTFFNGGSLSRMGNVVAICTKARVLNVALDEPRKIVVSSRSELWADNGSEFLVDFRIKVGSSGSSDLESCGEEEDTGQHCE